MPAIEGLSRVETQVLAALARAPRGLATLRAVARRAGVSPTAAAGALRSLAERGSSAESVSGSLLVVPARSSSSARTWPHPSGRRWHRALPPGGCRSAAARRPERLPARLRHLFWNADPSRLDLRPHGGYIAGRLLSSGDLDGLAWGARALSAGDWEEAARNRGLSAEERALARNLARSAGG